MLYFSSENQPLEGKFSGLLDISTVKLSHSILSCSFLSRAQKTENKQEIIHRPGVQKAKIIIQLILIISYRT